MSTQGPGRRARGWGKARVFTVGHSTRPAVELVELLRAYGIRTLGDIRTVPRSRTNPQYNTDVLELMCVEAVPWRCHRSLVADALWARGVVARHISSPTRAPEHRLTPFAELHGTRVLYPPEGADAPTPMP